MTVPTAGLDSLLPTPPKNTPWYRKAFVAALVCAGLFVAARYAKPAMDAATTLVLSPTPVAAATPEDDPPPNESPTRTPPQKSAAAASYEKKLRTAEQAANDTNLNQRLAAAKAAQKVLTELGKEINGVLDEANTELDLWNKKVPPLLTNEEGKFVAGNPESTKAFRALRDLERPGTSDIVKIRTDVEMLLANVESAQKNSNNLWDKTAETENRLKSLLSQSKSLRVAVRDSRVQLCALATAAKRDGKSSDLTLEQAIDLVVNDEAVEKGRLIANARDISRQANDKLLAETIAEADLRDGETSRKSEAVKREISRKEEEAKADTKLREAAKATLRAKAKTPEVQQDLAVFLAKGYSQPRAGGSGFFDRTAESAPVSFTRLKTGGYLDDSTDGLKKLLRLGAEPNRDNDRPKWKFNPHRLDSSNEEFLKRVQGMLRDLGPVMVEEGMLAK